MNDIVFSPEEEVLLNILSQKETNRDVLYGAEGVNLAILAINHGILSLVYQDILNIIPLKTKAMEKLIKDHVKEVALKNYRLFSLGLLVIKAFKKEDIDCCILKGASTSSFYPVPELRYANDVDVLLGNKKDLQKALSIIEKMGFLVLKQQHSFHHVEAVSRDGYTLEIHTRIVEPVDDELFNKTIDEIIERVDSPFEETPFLGTSIPSLCLPLHGFELMIHMVQHFMLAGLNLKLLYDWKVFWSKASPDEKEKKLYMALINELGLKSFSDTVTLTCVKYFNLPFKQVEFMELKEVVSSEEFIREILDSRDVNKDSKSRMVALRNDSFSEYVREFHHQMHRNFPKAGNIVILWPFMWVFTLGKFLYNNKRLNRPGALSFMKSARERGRLSEKLGLFKK